eukprot:CAMPEP_0197179794 /NCGR_PEP_ID=MMETSP1423-20130617/4630_1 /TAXON_ID=476441 /ORGANISM="Pseudo-nitzschia heimii, Strain UNC1101" /LENGTH=1007 /DNA_ID=CAMNT_0042629759 /DNA_START=132 /DNA_END=3155 /DNA_ORIENTATION=+
MSSVLVNKGHDNVLKKQKKKYLSPFRIKVGCLVAFRYRSRGNQVSLVASDRDPSTLGVDGEEGKHINSNKEHVTTAHFSEVWTDPRRGRDDGLALIGSMIRCFFQKTILSEPYNAVSRILEGTVVNVVRDCQYQSSHEERVSSGRSSFMVDLLVDNKNNKTLSITLPFLKRLDIDDHSDPTGKNLKRSEQRRRQYEERIKGGKHKAVVRVSLRNSCFPDSTCCGGKNPLEAKWVIRKRVATKICRREVHDQNVSEIITGYDDCKGEVQVKDINAVSDNELLQKMREATNSGEKDEKLPEESNDKHTSKCNEKLQQHFPESIKQERQKKVIEIVTSFNKDFSTPRYLGDGNDSTAQQEGNWRWEAGRYHNSYHAALADRPISKSLIEKLSYNFVGEVVDIHPMQPQRSKSTLTDTLAVVTVRLLVLPEHTLSGRLAHHGPLDLFETDDIELFKHLQAGGKYNDMQRQLCLEPGIKINDKNTGKHCLLQVPIEELVIVESKIWRGYLGSENGQETQNGSKKMTIQYSYSFLNNVYSRCKLETKDSTNSFDLVKVERSGSEICRRCRHLSTDTKRLAGIPHTLCEHCFDFLKHSDTAKRIMYQKNKSKRYQCDCSFCVDRKNADLLIGLADEVLESESNLASTLHKLEDYSAHRDSGFIATRFILKSMNQVDFTVSPSSLASSIYSAPSKPVTKIKSKVSKGSRKRSIRSGSKIDGKKRNNKSPVRQGVKRSFSTIDHASSLPISKNEPFHPKSSRLLPYDVVNRKFDVSAAELYQWKIFRSSISTFPEKPRNLRQHKTHESGGESTYDDSSKVKLQGRAARAKQRRLLRSVSSLGVDVDILAGRETNVRFDRSNIHGWGVFTDIDIRQGEMIIEYRGELIGNTMAEKREKEYEAAKIGSDYMFRIDEYTVCDASKHGNVARFINASCSPNCYPKIIFLDGTKRVVVYAKRDIRAGEELCYDYKFDLEYDPAKRIPCICGAPECRGFLNWDQRYVAIPSANDSAKTGSKN